MAEKRSFTVDPAILFSIINSQAGTLAKAMLEAVMNAIDAGATKCDITLSETGFTCDDNGRGFASREEILNWFERFGTPHEEGDATYGRFRMGRGQMMAFGSTAWRTGTFEMHVDIKNRGLDYDLGTLSKPVKGCSIKGTLYSPMSLHDLRSVITELEELVAYAQIPVKLNGKVVSRNPAKLKWDVETEDAYIKINSGNTLKVYNLGVLVRGYGSYKFGTGGVVVSKRQLQVNFARNDVLEHSCEVWRRIWTHLSKQAKSHVVRKATLTDNEREFIARNILSGSMPEGSDVLASRIITVATGVHVPLSSFLWERKVALAPADGHRLAERLHRAKVGYLVSPKTLERFGVETLEGLVNKLKEAFPAQYRYPEVVGFNEVAGSYTSKYTPVAEKDATPVELIALRLLRKANLVLGNWLAKHTEFRVTARNLWLGSSDAALAWTDGKTQITVEKRYLARQAKKGVDGWFQVLMVMLHEYCHVDPDLDGHEHPQEFYEMFEDLACSYGNPVGSLALAMAAKFTAEEIAAGRKVSGKAAASLGGRDKTALALVSSAKTLIEDDADALGIAAKAAPAKKKSKSDPDTPKPGADGQLSLL